MGRPFIKFDLVVSGDLQVMAMPAIRSMAWTQTLMGVQALDVEQGDPYKCL